MKKGTKFIVSSPHPVYIGYTPPIWTCLYTTKFGVVGRCIKDGKRESEALRFDSGLMALKGGEQYFSASDYSFHIKEKGKE